MRITEEVITKAAKPVMTSERLPVSPASDHTFSEEHLKLVDPQTRSA